MNEHIQAIATPTILFTQSDVEKVVKLVQPKQLKKSDSILVVSSGASVESLPNFGYLSVVQQTKRRDTGKEKAVAAWNVKVPLIQLKFDDATRHVFKVDSRCFDEQPIQGTTHDTAPLT